MAQQIATLMLLSSSTDGEPIQIAATATLGTAIHTAPSGTTTVDQVSLYATNISNAAVTLTLEWGAAGVSKNIVMQIPALSVAYPIPGILIRNSLEITGFASVTNVVNVFGSINRIG